jgi:MazG family protein
MMDTAAAEFSRLIEIVARLRAPGGCPWDREQTIDSLKPFVLEETYEVLETIDRHDHQGLGEELGDFLFQAVFLAQLESEAGHFTMADSVRSIADKLVRRHPHVFGVDQGEARLETAGDARAMGRDQSAGARTQAQPQTLLGGIPRTLPALRALDIGVRLLRSASIG